MNFVRKKTGIISRPETGPKEPPPRSESAKIREALLQRLEGKAVLDIGCGLEKIVPWATGVDDGSESNAVADLKADVGPGGDLATRLKGRTFDVVFSSHTLEHIGRPVPEVLAAWGDLVSPGGILIAYLPDERHYRFDPANPSRKNPAHVHLLTFDTFMPHAGALPGFSIEEARMDLGPDRYSFLVVLRKDASRVNALKKEIAFSDIGQTGQEARDFTLWWTPKADENREKGTRLLDKVKAEWLGTDVLQVGYPWAGRTVPGSKVLDLYDPRVSEIDYRLDACAMTGIQDDSFDLVICCSVLEHIPQFWLAAREIERVLRKGGLAWIGVPWVWPYHPSDSHAALGAINFGGDYWRMNHSALESLFGRCERLASWYDPALPSSGDDPRSGWGAMYVGIKRR